MREHKYRAWDNKDGIMLKHEELIDRSCIHDFLDEFIPVYEELIGKYSTNRIYMQWTGLSDKNGVDIYEGDIIKTDEGLTVKIVWDKIKYKCFGSVEKTYQGEKYIEKIEFELSVGTNDKRFGVEVIGNIFENEDLLNGRKDEK